MLKGSLLPDGGVEIDFKKIDGPGGKFLVAASSTKSVPCLTGQQYTIEPVGQPAFDAALVTCGVVEPRIWPTSSKRPSGFPGCRRSNALYSIGLRVNGYTVLPPPLWEEEFEESVGKEGVRIMSKAWAHFAKKARNAAAQPGGISTDELQKRMLLPWPVYDFLTRKLVEDEELRIREGFFLPVADPESYLSPLARRALVQLDEKGDAGIDLENEPNHLFQKTYRDWPAWASPLSRKHRGSTASGAGRRSETKFADPRPWGVNGGSPTSKIF